MKSISVDRIHLFWRWFSGAANGLAQQPRDDALVRALDHEVKALAAVSWELGPGHEKPNMLVLSPDGQKDLLPVTRRIIALAPKMKDWEFHSAKPPKQWQLRFSLEDNGLFFHIDATAWHYVLYRFPDSSFDIVILAPELRNLKSSLRQSAARTALDGILGEAKRLELIEGIDVLVEESDETVSQASPMPVLGDHLADLASQ